MKGWRDGGMEGWKEGGMDVRMKGWRYGGIDKRSEKEMEGKRMIKKMKG